MKKIVITAVCIFLTAIGSVFAQGSQAKSVGEFGPEVFYFRYREPGVMKDVGVFYGLTGNVSSRDGNRMMKLEGRLSWGEVDYENSGTMDNVDDSALELRGLGGYDFSVSKAVVVTPYLGLAYRYLNDDSAGRTTSTGAYGYERESNYYYSPIGVEFTAKLPDTWSLGLVLEYDYFWRGVQKSHLSDVSLGYNDLENDQNKGFGARGSVKVSKKTKDMDIVIEPFVRYWNIKKSEDQNITFAGVIIGYGYEPKNNTIEAGLKLAAYF